MLVQHGILCSSTDWVIAGPNSSLGEYFTEIKDLSAYAVLLYLDPGGSPRARVLYMFISGEGVIFFNES